MSDEKVEQENILSDEAVEEMQAMLQTRGWLRLKTVMQSIIDAIAQKHFTNGTLDENTYRRDIGYAQALTGVMNITDHVDDLYKNLVDSKVQPKENDNGGANAGQRRKRGY